MPRWRDTLVATAPALSLLLLAARACPPLQAPRHWPWRARLAAQLARMQALGGRREAALAVLDEASCSLGSSLREVEQVPPVASGVRWALGHAAATVQVARFAVEAGGFGAGKEAALRNLALASGEDGKEGTESEDGAAP